MDAILPLPTEVAAQIKSSTSVTSLVNVLLELMKNSLDSGARKINCTTDFFRGACTVEDDGLGIKPRDFQESGGLGKPYRESRSPLHSQS